MSKRCLSLCTAFGLALLLAFVPSVGAADSGADESVIIDGIWYASFSDFVGTDHFKASQRRCGTPDPALLELLYPTPIDGGVPNDCGNGNTNPAVEYEPGSVLIIPVVVHVIMNNDGSLGDVSNALVESQIDILNEDFQALAGTNGANGYNVLLQFELATQDPMGNPTNGITRSMNTTWYNDGGNYWDTLNWDPSRYMNIYTNTAGGNLGYVPFLPANGGGALVGTAGDRVVVLWTSFGRNSSEVPFHLGRTTTHEVGHYLGLNHTFNNGCGTASSPGCYTTGDLICDTNAESAPFFGGSSAGGSVCSTGGRSTCSSADPIDNYMDYSDDICMEMFTQEQARRMRCTLEHYRFELPESASIFTDGFESGDTLSWSSSLP